MPASPQRRFRQLRAFAGRGDAEDEEKGGADGGHQAGVVGDQDAVVFVVDGDVGEGGPEGGGYIPLLLFFSPTISAR